ncbi:MAG: class D sortase [Chloroflexota bacterium]
MSEKVNPDNLSVEELRRLLVEKRRADRQRRLERFRQTGRVVILASDVESSTLDDLRSDVPSETVDRERKGIRSQHKKWLDRALLAVEVLAVVGLFVLVYNGVKLVRELNKEVVTVLEQPTLTPTPLIVAIVLPSGHTSPTSPGGARPNEAEIPEHLRPLVQSFAGLPIPTPGPEQAIRIRIPTIGVDAPVVQGDGWEQLKKGVGQHVGSANPGQNGNVILSAHNDIFGEIFRYLDQLVPGDQIILYTNQRSYIYRVTETKLVEPTYVEVLAATTEPVVTLISCYPYMVDNKRIVVQTILEGSE